jgi:hypothetical protein
VFDIFGQEFVDRVGLMAGEDREFFGGAVAAGAGGFQEADDVLHDAQETGVEGEALGEVGFAVAAEDAAAVGGERDARVVGEGSSATGRAPVELGEVAGFSEELDFKGEEGLFESGR